MIRGSRFVVWVRSEVPETASHTIEATLMVWRALLPGIVAFLVGSSSYAEI
jgi:hypothetical protein